MKIRILFSLMLAPFGVATAAPTLVVQGEGVSQFRSVVVANGGRWIASNDHAGGPIKLYLAKSGLQWGTLPLAAGASPLRFTPDATHLLTTRALDELNGPQTQVTLVAIPSGRPLRSFEVAPYLVWCDNGRLRGIWDKAVVEFDLRSGRTIARHRLQDAPRGNRNGPRYAFSSNGAYLIEASGGVIRWWSARTGKILGRIKDSRRAIHCCAISADGKWLVSEGDDPNWSPPTDGPGTEAAYARNFNFPLWNARTKKVVRTFPGYYSLSGAARLLAFSPDGRTLFGAGDEGFDRYNVATGKNATLPVPEKDGTRRMKWPFGVSPDGLWLAGIGRPGVFNGVGPQVQLWSLSSGKCVAASLSPLGGLHHIAWSPDGRYLSSGLMLWDAHSGQLVSSPFSDSTMGATWVNATTLRTQTLSKLQLRRVPDLTLLSESDFSLPPTDSPSSAYSGGLLVSPDGRFVLTTDTGGTRRRDELWVWDVASHTVVQKIKLQVDTGAAGLFDLKWLPDSTHVVAGTRGGLVLLNVLSGVVEKEWQEPLEANPTPVTDKAAHPLRLSADGKWLVATVPRGGIVVFDVQSLTPNPAEGEAWWQQTKEAASKLVPAPPGYWETGASPDGRLVAFRADYNQEKGVSIYNRETGRQVLRLQLCNTGWNASSTQWFSLTPEGFYNASPGGEKYLRWREGRSFWPLSKSRARFNRPDLVAKALTPSP